MADLEYEMAALRAQVREFGERVRLDAVARRFLDDNHEIRQGDFFRINCGSDASRLGGISSEGKWTYVDGHGHCIEPHRVPEPGDHERLYTIAEVAEIVAKVTREANS